MPDPETRACPVCGEVLSASVRECSNCGAVLGSDLGQEAKQPAVEDTSSGAPAPKAKKNFFTLAPRNLKKQRARYRSLEKELLQLLELLHAGKHAEALKIIKGPRVTKTTGLQDRLLWLAIRGVRESLQTLSAMVQPSVKPVPRPASPLRFLGYAALAPILILALVGAWDLINASEVPASANTPFASPTIIVSPTFTPTEVYVPTSIPQTQPILVDNIDRVTELFYWSAGEDILSLAFSPDGKLIASGDSNNIVKVWRVWQDQPIWELEGTHVAFSPGGEWLGIAGPKGLYLYRTSDGGLARALDTAHSYESVAFSPNGQTIAGGVMYRAYIWGVNDGSEQQGPGGVLSPVHHLQYTQDARLLVVASNDNAYVWNLQKQKIERSVDLRKQQPVYYSATIDDDGEWFAHGLEDGNIYVWQVSNGVRMATLDDRSRFVYGLQFLYGSNWPEILVSGDEVNLSFWVMDSEARLGRSIFVSTAIHSLAIAPGNTMIATGGNDGVIHLWGVIP